MRSEDFKQKKHGRYWWFHQCETPYIPPVLSFLHDKEWKVIEEWYKQTEELNWSGECNIPTISFLQGLIMGSSIKNIVQLGTYAGFSTLLIGYMMKRMDFQHSFITIDKDAETSAVAQYWINKSELNDHVTLIHSNSTNINLPKKISEEFDNQAIQLLFISCSSQYEQTLEELDFWYAHVADKGFIILHNATAFAARYDQTKEGGISRALSEWSLRTGSSYFVINDSIEQDKLYNSSNLVYKDLGGLAIIQK
jgi:predicted O-methyltransferase YrrM